MYHLHQGFSVLDSLPHYRSAYENRSLSLIGVWEILVQLTIVAQTQIKLRLTGIEPVPMTSHLRLEAAPTSLAFILPFSEFSTGSVVGYVSNGGFRTVSII